MADLRGESLVAFALWGSGDTTSLWILLVLFACLLALIVNYWLCAIYRLVAASPRSWSAPMASSTMARSSGLG